ncbi:class I SAM-dependent methyltransferase [Micromonospora sp. CPCC 205371]|nr:class I SAM-dependent methyltransferase [Micromonospora sp. CPCC 205371]
MVTRHDFLATLHTQLQPRGYLEIGVQHGYSLRLASCPAVGVDPDPKVVVPLGPHATVVPSTSDAYFTTVNATQLPFAALDLAFIDGMHLYEYALRDFIGVERLAHAGAVVVFDDVLPRNQVEAARVQCPGDWTGDVWRIEPVLRAWRPDLHITLVDTDPTGVLVVYGLEPASTVLADEYDEILRHWPLADVPVPPDVLHRYHAVPPEMALAEIEDWRTTA